VERQFSTEQLVHLAAPRGIKENDPLATRQPCAQVYLRLESRLPGTAFLRRSPDLDVDPFWRDALVRCDRSQSERNSTPQRSADQLDRAGVRARVVVASLNLQQPLADPHLSRAIDIPYLYRVAGHQALNTCSQSATVTPGVSMGRWS
jgi:hypothetical protein